MKDKKILDRIEKKIIDGNKIIILSKRRNNLIWYFSLLVLIGISLIEFFIISMSKSLLSFSINIAIVIIVVAISFFIFFYNKIKIKIIKGKNGRILIEILESISIKEREIKPVKGVYFYSKHFGKNCYGLGLRYKTNKSQKLNLDLMPYYENELRNPVFLNKEKVIEIGEFLKMKVVFLK